MQNKCTVFSLMVYTLQWMDNKINLNQSENQKISFLNVDAPISC